MSATLDALEHRLFQLETLYEIGRECASAPSLQEALQITLSMVMGAFGVVRGLAFAGGSSGTVAALQVRGFEREPIAGGLDAGALARMYLTSAAPGVSSGVSVAASNREAWLGAAGLEVCFPFTLDETTSGALALGARLSGTPYSADECALLQTIVSNAAVHLRQAQLLATVRATAAELEQKVRALSVINEIALGITNRPGASRLHRFLVERIAT
ncbi:MAG TPA: GAF domain-containing protein, partial [Chloroflexota bacterium]|nr:GAF domain-containing protein [Chloroflexota bacterium]